MTCPQSNGLEGADMGSSLVVQWLRLHAPNPGGLGSFPGQRTRSHMLQLRTGAVKYITILKRKTESGRHGILPTPLTSELGTFTVLQGMTRMKARDSSWEQMKDASSALTHWVTPTNEASQTQAHHGPPSQWEEAERLSDLNAETYWRWWKEPDVQTTV